MESTGRIRGRAAAAAAVALLLVANIPALLRFAAGRGGEPVGADAPAYVRIARTLLATGSVVLPGPGRIDANSQQRLADPFGTPWALSKDGRLLPKHPIAFALLLLPGVALGGAKGVMVEGCLLGAALAAFVTWRASRDFGALAALLAGLAVLWASPAARFVLCGVNVDTVIAFLLVGSLAAAADGHPFAAGLLAGLSPLFRPTAPLLFLALPFVVRARADRRSLARAAAGFACGLLPFAAANTLMFGAPWITPYQRAAVLVDGALRVTSHAGAFGRPTLAALHAILLDPDGGLLTMAPAAALALFGFLLPGVRTPERLGAALVPLAAYLALSGYAFVTQISGTNYRFALPFTVATVAPLAGMLALVLRRGSTT